VKKPKHAEECKLSISRQNKRGAWQTHKRLPHILSKINLFRTSLDHLLLGKAADSRIINPNHKSANLDFECIASEIAAASGGAGETPGPQPLQRRTG